MSHKHLRTLLAIVFAAHQIFAEDAIQQTEEKIIKRFEWTELKLMAQVQFENVTEIAWHKWVDNEWRNVEELDMDCYIGYEGELYIESLYEDHAGKYRCSYISDFGRQEYVMSLVVLKRTEASIEHDKPIKGKRIAVRCRVFADPSVTYTIDWKLNNTEIDFENESNFIKEADDTLVIREAGMGDSGLYTCVVTTHFDGMHDVIGYEMVIVRDFPRAPHIKRVNCTPWVAVIEWEPNNEYGTDAVSYTIEANNAYNPNKWIELRTTGAEKQSMHVDLYDIEYLGWVNYTFRVIANNDIGPSTPSEPSVEICTSVAMLPFALVQNVKVGLLPPPGKLFISWNPMPPSMHFGPNFYYIVRWKQYDATDLYATENLEDWSQINITDWTQNNITIDGLQVFTPYRFQVNGANIMGELHMDQFLTAYSGEDEPSLAPANFSVVHIIDFETVILRWDPVPSESINGNLSLVYYGIHVWNDVDGRKDVKFGLLNGLDTCQTPVTGLRSFTVHYAQIFVMNRIYAGPKSEILEFKTSLPDPSSVQAIEAHPLGSSAFLLKWTKPLQTNGKLTGYKIFYANETNKYERNPRITDPDATQAKLGGLNPNSAYRLYIRPIMNSINAKDYYIHARTNAPEIPTKPDRPSFSWKIMSSYETNVTIRVNWIPNLGGHPGSHFSVKYRSKREESWTVTEPVYEDDYVIVYDLPKDETYQFQVISIDGDLRTVSDVQEIFSDSLSPPLDNKNIVIVSLAVVAVSTVLSLGIFILFLKRRAINRALRKLRVHNSHDIGTGKAYQNNKNLDIHSVSNRYEVKPTQQGKYNTQISSTVFNYGIEDITITTNALEDFMNGNPNKINVDVALDRQADSLPYDQTYEFPRDKLELGKELGNGAFGVVYEAKAYGILPNEDQTTVAVKTVKKMADNEIFRAFVLELKIMIYLGKHLNIVNLLGAVTKNVADRELMIIVEHCAFGNLQSFLVKNRQHFVDQIVAEDDRIDPNIKCRKVQAPTGYSMHTSQAPASGRSITTTDLLCWSFQIARGMHYLASRKVLHGDLAARNILLCENNVVKICDFGLARSMYKTGNYLIKTERLLPYKWLAPESIGDHVFSTYSDVWSFGILMWELFSLGAVPYPGMIADATLFKMLKEGYRMECPDFATQPIYDIMFSCWHEIPESRPLFDELSSIFSGMLDQNVSNHYISLNEQYSKHNKNHLNSIDKTNYFKFLTTTQSEPS